MKVFGTIVGWLISVGCLGFALMILMQLIGLSVPNRPIDGPSLAIGLAVLPFYLAAGLAFNPLVFVRLPFARGFWSRLLVALAIVAIGLGVGWLVLTFMPNPVG